MTDTPRATRRWLIGVFAALIFSLPVAVFAVVVSTNIYFLEADATQREDVYVVANAARVFGTIDGDLVVAAGDVTIAGVVTGDLVVASQGRITISGEVGGSVRGIAREIAVSGAVGDDIAVVAGTIDITGAVDRDVLLLAATIDTSGQVGRDILGRVQSATLDGRIGGDVDVLVGTLTLESSLDAAGDVIYRSSSDASVSSSSEIAGSLSRLPTTGSFVVRGVLLFVNVIHLLGFLFAGLVLLWLFQRTMAASVGEIQEHPLRSVGIGLITIVAAPVVVVLLVFSLVGIPVGMLLLIVFLLSLFFGPIPAVTALGHRLLGGRGALFGGFLLGAIVWRAGIWLLPWIGLVIYGVSLAAGIGGFVSATIRRRRLETAELPLIPDGGAASSDAPQTPEGWEPPLAPSPGSLDPHGDRSDDEEDS